MNKKTRILLMLAIILIAVGVGGGYYVWQSSKYVKTEDAKVQGDLRAIGSLSAGKLIEWRHKEGDSFKKGDILGIVETSPAHGNIPAITQDILAPEEGTVILTNAVKDQTVAPGAALAMSADLDRLYITANLEETEIDEIHIGNKVTFSIDAFPDQQFTGRVEQIGLGTNSAFSLMPVSNSSGNFTKVVQRIPVKIFIDDYQGKRFIPGFNAAVKIEK